MASRLLLIAPDPSGDTLGAHFCKVWRKGGGGQVWALGGDQLRQEGAEVKWDSAPFQTLGFLDALFKLPQTRPLWKEIIRTLPLVNGVVVVDARFLMERIAPHVQRAGLPLVWLAPSPDWRKAGESTSRTERLSLLVDYLWVTDPLAWRAYKNSEKATRFAHPRFQDTPSVKREKGLLALLPGSRPSEIIRHKNTFIKAASLVDWAKRVVVSDPFGIVGKLPPGIERDCKEGGALLERCQKALVASGTALQEAVVRGTPAVAAYKGSPLLWAWIKLGQKAPPYWTHPNLMAGDEIVPEFIQGRATADALAEALMRSETEKERRILESLAHAYREGSDWEVEVSRWRRSLR